MSSEYDPPDASRLEAAVSPEQQDLDENCSHSPKHIKRIQQPTSVQKLLTFVVGTGKQDQTNYKSMHYYQVCICTVFLFFFYFITVKEGHTVFSNVVYCIRSFNYFSKTISIYFILDWNIK